MRITVPIPTFDRRLDVPLPSLSGRQLLFIGGAATLGITEILSAPVAAVVAAAPLLQKGVRRVAMMGNGSGAGGDARRAPTRRPSATRTRPAATRGRSTAKAGAASTRRTTGRSGTRSSRRSPAASGTSSAATA